MIKVNELFAGIGAFRKALINLGIEHEVVGISEIDKYAIKSYEAMYGTARNYGDISKIERLDYADVWTYGFPCQDISNAGLQKGIIKGETRSGLLYEVERLLGQAAEDGTLPKYLIMENVKALVGKKFKPDFDRWVEYLGNAYNTYWKVLNAKDYGLPQNRERVFAISIRKDIDNGLFTFPEPVELKYRLKDFLDSEVDEKYFLSEKALEGINRALTDGRDHKPPMLNDSTDYAPTLDTKCGDQTQRSPYFKQDLSSIQMTRTSEPKETDVCNTLLSRSPLGAWGNNNPITLVKQETLNPMPDGTARTIKRQYQNTSPCCFGYTGSYGATGVKAEDLSTNNFRIRKLTPRECWRLQGFSTMQPDGSFDDTYFERAESVVSNSQLYKQAGNSIAVPCLEGIMASLLQQASVINYE